MVFISWAVVPNICFAWLMCELKTINIFSGAMRADDGINVCNWVQTGVRMGVKMVLCSEACFLLEMRTSSSYSPRQSISVGGLPTAAWVQGLVHRHTRALVKGGGLVKCAKLDSKKVLTTWTTQFFIRNQSEVKERYRIVALW